MAESVPTSLPHDGGPAFPREDYQTNGREDKPLGQQGMSLRDYFAAKVMQGFAANPAIFAPNPHCGWSLANCTDGEIVGYAYKLADEMLAYRASNG